MDGAAAVAARTFEIAANGVSLTVEKVLKVAQQGQLTFEMYVDGKSHIISSRISVLHCIFSSNEFKVGLQFKDIDPASAAAIAKYMR